MVVARWLVMLCLTTLAACGSTDRDRSGPSGTSSSTAGDSGTSNNSECVDNDEDGFGRACELGRDCDDRDPSIGGPNDAGMCCGADVEPRPGCSCEPGTRPAFCKPPDIKVQGGVLQCSEGTLYCREGEWSDCEIIGQYTFVPTAN